MGLFYYKITIHQSTGRTGSEVPVSGVPYGLKTQIYKSIWKEGDLNICFDKLLNARKEERSVPSAFAVLGLTKL